MNYAHAEVREHHMALVRELLERYDMDGLELDWMRFGYHLTPGREREEGAILTEFVRATRALTNEWSTKRGHPVLLGVRVPAHPDAAAGLGMDGVAWAQEGLIDLLIPCPFWSSSDFDIPVELWRERLGPAADKVTVAPGLEYNARPWPGGAAVANDLACARGFAASAHHRGADSLYLFNWMDSETRPVEVSDYQVLLREGLSPQAVSRATAAVSGVLSRHRTGGLSQRYAIARRRASRWQFPYPHRSAARVCRRVGRDRLGIFGRRRRHALGGVAQRSSAGRSGRLRQCQGTGRWRDPRDSHPVPTRDVGRGLQQVDYSPGRRIDSSTDRVGRIAGRAARSTCQVSRCRFQGR